jgi:hypothetical protein
MQGRSPTLHIQKSRDEASQYRYKSTGLKTGRQKTLSSGGAGHALGAAFGDVAVSLVPANGAL